MGRYTWRIEQGSGEDMMQSRADGAMQGAMVILFLCFGTGVAVGVLITKLVG